MYLVTKGRHVVPGIWPLDFQGDHRLWEEKSMKGEKKNALGWPGKQ